MPVMNELMELNMFQLITIYIGLLDEIWLINDR